MEIRTKLLPYFFGFFLVMVAIEALWSRYKGDDRFTKGDTWASLGTGVGSIFIGGLLRTGMFAIMFGLYDITPLRVPFTWWRWPKSWR